MVVLVLPHLLNDYSISFKLMRMYAMKGGLIELMLIVENKKLQMKDACIILYVMDSEYADDPGMHVL